MNIFLKIITSLRLTVILLSLGMMLVFFGTLDQVNTGIWVTQKRYFESLFVFWSYPAEWAASDTLGFIRIPMPGGYLLGIALIINLVAAHVYRFKLTWKKSGIFLVHIGLILLLVSELLTDVLSRESQMSITEGGKTYYSEAFRDNELVFINRGNPDYDDVVSIPQSILSKKGTIEYESLPFSVRIDQFYPNSVISRRGNQPTMPPTPVTHGLGAHKNRPTDLMVNEQPVRYDDQSVNTVSAIITLTGTDGTNLGTWLVSNLLDDRFPRQTLQVGEENWDLAIRFRRYYHDFGLALHDFRFDRYPGTEIPKNFSSEVSILDDTGSTNQRALIYMNHPLRYGGLTFFQASYDPETEETTILQVVRNPGWLLPYISVLLMGAGMTVQFSMHLGRFASRRKREEAPA